MYIYIICYYKPVANFSNMVNLLSLHTLKHLNVQKREKKNQLLWLSAATGTYFANYKSNSIVYCSHHLHLYNSPS